MKEHIHYRNIDSLVNLPYIKVIFLLFAITAKWQCENVIESLHFVLQLWFIKLCSCIALTVVTVLIFTKSWRRKTKSVNIKAMCGIISLKKVTYQLAANYVLSP